MSANLGKLESVIGHSFSDVKLLERSLTHRSWAFENLRGQDEAAIRGAENESMEFLGDSILGLVIAERLYLAHPEHDEGELTLMKHHLVSTATLARVAETLDLGEYVRVGRGEEKTGGRRRQAMLANTLEAVIAAVFLDGGYPAARVFVGRIFADELRATTPGGSADYKSMLQELLQAKKLSAPSYTVISTDGPPHSRVFAVEATWATGKSRGQGSSIKAAEMMAAAEALAILKLNGKKRGALE